MKTTSAILTLTLFLTQTLCALPPQSDHGSLRAVPAPGTVTIDGRLDEWDTSGEMFVYGVRNIRDRYSARVTAMWDKDALYLGLRWRDPTPLINNVDPDRAPGEGWMADSLQCRFITDWSQIHFTSWYGSKHDKSVAYFSYDAPVNPANEKTFRAAGRVLRDGSGFQQAFAVDNDQRGYVQEIRIPWALLYKNPQPAAGLKFRFTGEYFWGGPSGTQWPAVMWSDPINPAMPQRIVLYQNPAVWGELELLGQGQLPVAAVEQSEERLQGPIPIRFTVPREAVRFSLVINDPTGNRVRNLASHANVTDYTVKSEGDKRTLEVPWDGRADGPWKKDWSLFVGDHVPAGNYTAQVIVHNGIGVVHAGSFYNPGTPPWPTADGSGSWLADHSPPGAVGAMPKASAAKGRVFLGARGVENGVGFIGLNGEGRKIWEWTRRGLGAWFIAANDKHLFLAFPSHTGFMLGRANPDTGESLAEFSLPGEPTGLAVRGNEVAVAIGAANKIVVFDAESGNVTREVAAEKPQAIAFRADGELVMVNAGKALLGVSTPLAVACDSEGRTYVADGAELNVKVFGKDGKLVRAIGEKGGHAPGPWNPQRMNQPVSIAVEERADGQRHIWVTENSFSPKRTSVWDAGTGKLVRDYIGSTRYSASGGAMSDDVPDLGLCDGVFYKVDYAHCDYAPIEVIGAPPAGEFANGNHFFSNASGREREYYIEGTGSPARVFVRRNGVWTCAAEIKELRGNWGYRCFRDLTWYDNGKAYRPVRFTDDGAPVYDPAQAATLPGALGQIQGNIYKTKFGYLADTSEGKTVDENGVVHGLHWFTGFDEQGRIRWKIPNYWCAVHGAMTAPMAMPGVIMGALKYTGVFDLDAKHSAISIRGNIGQEFLLRDDGMYLGELFTDQRMAPASLPPEEHIAGVPINDTTLGGEPFSGWMARQRDGKVRMTYGQQDVRIAEVVGLDTVKDLPAIPIALTEAQVAQAKAFTPAKGASQRTEYTIARGGAFGLEAKFGDDAIVVRAGREEVGRAQLRYDDQNLHVAWQVFDPTPLVNKGTHPPEAFQTGDSVNLFLGNARVLLTSLAGKPTAVVYRPQGPGDKRYVFKSPVRESAFQYVGEEPAIQWQAAPGQRRYTVVAAIPWSALDVKPAAGLKLKGDIGILFADDTGARTAQRVQWADKETNVVNDQPTEAEFLPSRWGTFLLQ